MVQGRAKGRSGGMWLFRMFGNCLVADKTGCATHPSRTFHSKLLSTTTSLVTFYQPHTDDDPFSEHIRSFAPLFRLMFCLFDELCLDSVGACNLDTTFGHGSRNTRGYAPLSCGADILGSLQLVACIPAVHPLGHSTAVCPSVLPTRRDATYLLEFLPIRETPRAA